MNKIKLTFNETTLEFIPTPATDLFLPFYHIYVNGKKTDYELVLESSGEDKWITFWDEDGKTYKSFDNTDEVTLDMVVDIYKTIKPTFRDLISELPENPNNFDETFGELLNK